MYVRPIIFGSGEALALHPPDEYTYLVYVAPVGNYYPGKYGIKALKIVVNTEYDRVGENGSGYIKNGGNYAPVMRFGAAAKKQGYDDCIFLDVKEHKYILVNNTLNNKYNIVYVLLACYSVEYNN